MDIYVGNFSKDITENDLRKAFSAFGYVEKVKLMSDKITGVSKGFGYVQMPNTAEANAAIEGISKIKNQIVKINEAKPPVKKNSLNGNGVAHQNINLRKAKRF